MRVQLGRAGTKSQPSLTSSRSLRSMSMPTCKHAPPANALVVYLLPQPVICCAVPCFAVLCHAVLCCAVSNTDAHTCEGCSTGAFLLPICSAVCDLVPDSRRKTTQNLLTVADLGKLPSGKLHQIYAWIIQHVHIQEMDHLMLSPDQTHLQMTPAWRTRLESANEFAWNPQNQVRCYLSVA